MFKAIMEKYFSEGLTDDAKTEIQTAFDLAVNEAVNAKLENAKTDILKENVDKIKQFKNELSVNVDEYLNEALTEWVEENQSTMDSSIKTTISENVLNAVIGALKENYIELDESETNIVKDLETQLEEAKNKLNTMSTKKVELDSQILEYKKALVFTEMTKDMTLTESETVKTAASDLIATDINAFKKQLNTIINIVEKHSKSNDDTTNLNENKNHDDLDQKLDTKNVEDKKSFVDKYLPNGKAFLM